MNHCCGVNAARLVVVGMYLLACCHLGPTAVCAPLMLLPVIDWDGETLEGDHALEEGYFHHEEGHETTCLRKIAHCSVLVEVLCPPRR